MSVDETKIEPLPPMKGTDEQPTVMPLSETFQQTASVPSSQLIGVRIRPKICDVRNCGADSLHNPDLLFVCVPTHNYPERRFVWLTLMQAVRDKKRSYCCSRHFKVPDDFKDFQEFISAPPGYKRQLLVKRGVVPHLNMPPLNMSALPPLTDRWPMTLPEGMTEADQLRHNAMTTSRLNVPPPRMYQGSQSYQSTMRPSQAPSGAMVRIKHSRGVQTDSSPFSIGVRRIAPSLQYCRLCFQKQDLEPIFTGDQTLIEPDLIDKIFGCTEVMISVESDFPSSICTQCYTKVQDFVKFRKLVQLNDRSLRGNSLPSLHSTPNQSDQSAAVPRQNSIVRMRTTEVVTNRPTLKVTPLRPVINTPPNSTQRSPTAQRRDDPLLEIQRVENVEQYQRRQQTIERNQPLRAQRMQDTLYPVPYRRPISDNVTIDDPLANADCDQKLLTDSESSSTPKGVQLDDRVVPVTLIRVQPDPSENAEPEVSHEGNDSVKVAEQLPGITVKDEEPSAEVPSHLNVSSTGGFSPAKNIIRPKPLHQLLRTIERKKQNAPNVLQAVKLLPSATAKALSSQKISSKPVNTLTRGVTSGRFAVNSMRKDLERTIPKQPTVRMFKKLASGVLHTLIHRAKKPQSALSVAKVPNSAEIPKPHLAASSNSELLEIRHPIQETLTAKSDTPSPIPKTKNPVDPHHKQKDNSGLDSPLVTQNDPISSIEPNANSARQLPTPSFIPASTPPKPEQQTKLKDSSIVKAFPPKLNRLAVVLSKLAPKTSSVQIAKPKTVSKPDEKDKTKTEKLPVQTTSAESLSPRSSRVRKVPLKFQNTVGFPMPKVVTIKPEPDAENTEAPQKTEFQKIAARVTRRSDVANESLIADIPTIQRKSETKKMGLKSKPKENDPPKKEPTRVTRKSDIAVQKQDMVQQTKAVKRKSNINPESKAHAPPLAKSPKMDLSKTKQETKVKELSTSKTSKEPTKAKQHSQQKEKQLNKRVSDSKTNAVASVSAQTVNENNPLKQPAEIPKRKKKPELERAKTPVSSQDWKCPFCANKVFDEKKRLVKHLRKRHGMDYALVRQRLAIYGGNWR